MVTFNHEYYLRASGAPLSMLLLPQQVTRHVTLLVNYNLFTEKDGKHTVAKV
jgi:hypothetical protein